MKQLFIFIFITVGLVLSNLEIKAQPTTWQRVFGLDSNAQGNYGIQTSDGGFLILSRWDPISAYPNLTRVTKLSQFGNLIWTRNYFVSTYDSMIEDNDSNYLLIGSGGLGGAGLLKINSNGDSILYKTYGGPSVSYFKFIKRYYDGGYIMTGQGSNGLKIFGYVVRADNKLNMVWAKNFNDSNYEDLYMRKFIFDPNNNIVVPITGFDTQKGLTDGGILKLTPDGNSYLKQFYKTFPVRDRIGEILLTNDNKYIISGGARYMTDSISSLICLVDTNGTLLFRKYYYDSPYYLNLLAYASENNYVMGGYYKKKMSLRKIDEAGNIIWTRSINDAITVSGPNDMIQTSDKGYLLTGVFINVPLDRYSIYVIKCDSNAHAKPIGITNQHIQIPDQFILYSPYPNPLIAAQR